MPERNQWSWASALRGVFVTTNRLPAVLSAVVGFWGAAL